MTAPEPQIPDVLPLVPIRDLVVFPYMIVPLRVTRPVSMEAVTKANWEMLGHSYEQQPIHIEQDPEEMIVKTLDILEKFTGQRPIGWLSPGFGQTFATPDQQTAAGLKYTCEWPYDDEPTRVSTKHGPLVTLSYSIEC